jgi:uncharacterized membrane protein
MTIKSLTKKITVVSALGLALLSTVKASALSVDDGINHAGGGGQSDKSVTDIVGIVVQTAMYAVGIISVIIIVFAGIMYATSAGDEAKVKKAKHAIIGGLVGLAIAILAWTITNFVFSALTT